MAHGGFSQQGPRTLSSQPVRFLYPHVAQGWRARPWEGDGQGAPRGHKSKLLPARGMGGRCDLMAFKENSCKIFCTSEFVAAIRTCYTDTPQNASTHYTHAQKPTTHAPMLPDTTCISRKTQTQPSNPEAQTQTHRSTTAPRNNLEMYTQTPPTYTHTTPEIHMPLPELCLRCKKAHPHLGRDGAVTGSFRSTRHGHH